MSMEGTTVGSYRIVRQIGVGGMGRVYLAEHAVLGKRAAVKVLLPEYTDDDEIVARFFNEARASSQLNHVGIVETYDFGHLPDGRAFIVMELCEGEPLSRRIHREGTLEPALALDIARQVANALSVTHENGIVHRDLKPDNVFLVPDRELRHGVRAKVLDFGIAKLAYREGQNRLTGVNSIIGTPSYMAPEQCRGGGDVDHRADVYALGCMLHKMVTGGPPFKSKNATDVFAAHMNTPPPSLTGILPSPYDELYLRMLAKDRNARVQSMREVSDELRTGVSSVSARTVANRKPEVATERTRRSAVPIVIAFGAVGAIAVALVIVRRSPPPIAVVDAPPVATPASIPAPIPAPVKPPAKTPEPPRRVHVTIASKPSGADVYRIADGLRVGQTPWSTVYDESLSEAMFSLRMKGYRPTNVSVQLDHDVTSETILEKVAKSTPAPKTAATKPRPARDDVVNPFDN